MKPPHLSIFRLVNIHALLVSIILHLLLFLMIGGVIIFEAPLFRPAMQVDSLSLIDFNPQEEDILEEIDLQTPELEALDEMTPLDGPTPTTTVPTISIPDLVTSSAIFTDSTFTMPVGAFAEVSNIIGQASGGGSSTGTGGVGKNLMQKFKSSNFFGSENATQGALTGTFYDLKQTNQGQPLSKKGKFGSYTQIIEEFSKSWNPSVLRPFFKASRTMSSPHIFIPRIRAEMAPKAFNVEKEVKPSRWVIHYQGDFVAPKTGKFRFVGLADDVILVRLQNKNVLDGSVVDNYFKNNINQQKQGRFVQWPFHLGQWFELQEGTTYPLEVLIGEKPGGFFFAFLMIQEEGVRYAKGSHGIPALPVFRTLNSTLPKYQGDNEKYMPKILPNGPIFQ